MFRRLNVPEALVAGKLKLQLIQFDVGLTFFPPFDNKMLGFSPINCPPTEENEKMHDQVGH